MVIMVLAAEVTGVKRVDASDGQQAATLFKWLSEAHVMKSRNSATTKSAMQILLTIGDATDNLTVTVVDGLIGAVKLVPGKQLPERGSSVTKRKLQLGLFKIFRSEALLDTQSTNKYDRISNGFFIKFNS